jgi:hypothetical protein
MSNVSSLHGGITGERHSVPVLVEYLEELLEKARSGEVIGVGVVERYYDGVVGSQVVGLVGSFAMVGGAEAVKADLLQVVQDG